MENRRAAAQVTSFSPSHLTWTWAAADGTVVAAKPRCGDGIGQHTVNEQSDDGDGDGPEFNGGVHSECSRNCKKNSEAHRGDNIKQDGGELNAALTKGLIIGAIISILCALCCLYCICKKCCKRR